MITTLWVEKQWVFKFDFEQMKARFPKEYETTIAEGRTDEDFLKESVSNLLETFRFGYDLPGNADHLDEGLVVLESVDDDHDWS